MKIKNLKALALAAILPSAMMLSGQAQAFWILDDFNSSETYVAGDPIPAPSSLQTPITAGNKVWNDFGNGTLVTPNNNGRRTIEAKLVSGDKIDTEVCSLCQAGHLVSGAGAGNGTSSFIYSGNAVDLSAATHMYFDYAADLAGAIVTFTFSNADIISSALLASTGSSAPSNMTSQKVAFGSGDYSAITSVRVDIQGVADLDLTIDNIKAVPEPETLALLGLGLLGFAFRRRSVTSISA